MTKPAHRIFTERVVRALMWEVDNMGFTPADLTEHIGGAERTFENYRYSATPTLEKFIGILRFIKPVRVMKMLAAQCDGHFIRLNGQKCTNAELAKHAASIMKESSDVLAAFASSLDDGKIDSGEGKALVKEINEAIEALLRAKMCIKHRKE